MNFSLEMVHSARYGGWKLILEGNILVHRLSITFSLSLSLLIIFYAWKSSYGIGRAPLLRLSLVPIFFWLNKTYPNLTQPNLTRYLELSFLFPNQGASPPDPPYHGIQSYDRCAKNRNSEIVGEVVSYKLFYGIAEIRTRYGWVRSSNATSVLYRPPEKMFLLSTS